MHATSHRLDPVPLAPPATSKPHASGSARRQREKTLQHARAALEQIETLRLSADPRSFELWYIHASGENPALSRAIGDLLRRARPIDPAYLDQIHEKFLASIADDQINESAKDIVEKIDVVAALIGALVGCTEDLSDRLRGEGEKVGHTASPSAIFQIVQNMMAAVQEANERNRRLQTSLQDAQQEIGHLQANLERAYTDNLTDALTGVGNRKHFDQELGRAVSESRAENATLSLLLCDVDHFKHFNDRYGHVLGDHVLRLIAAAIKATVRDSDVVARYGGEEFAVILPRTTPEHAVTVAEKIRAAIGSKPLVNRATGESLGSLTISIGIAELRAQDNRQRLVERADACLYVAKETGRDKTVWLPTKDESGRGRVAIEAAQAS